MAKQHSPRFVELVDDARGRIHEIEPSDLQARRAAGADLHVIDVREDNEFKEGHLRGARHLGKGVIERDIEKAVPDRDAEIVLYCGGGYRSALAADNLQKMGYNNVYSLAGGFRALKDEGFEIER